MSQKPLFNISERIFFLRLIDLIVVFVSILVVSQQLNLHYFRDLETNMLSWFITLSVYIVLFGQIFELYNLKVSSSRYLVVRSLVLTSLFVTIFYIFTPKISPELPLNRIQILYLFLLIFMPILVWRFIYIGFVTLPRFHKYILIVGSGKKLKSLVKSIKKHSSDIKIVGYLSDSKIDKLKEYQFYDVHKFSVKELIEKNSITEIVVAQGDVAKTKQVHNDLVHLFENGVPIIGEKRFIEKISNLVPELDYNDSFYDYFNFSKNHESNLYLFFTRIIDIIISLFGLLFLVVAFPIILLGNLFANRGTPFYLQERVGEKGKLFTIYKFRTMVKNAEKHGAVWAEKDDHRITTFGNFLRKSRLDELPQFYNILRGEMSLIGPRPERPEFVDDLEEKIPYYAIRHVIKPGLTGWAQVMMPYANDLEGQKIKLRYDLYYIKERGVFLDFKIIIKTISTVLFYRGQ